MIQAEVVVIADASAGVGRATARAFAWQGAHIGLLARGRDGLEAARQEIEKAGGRALALPTDVSDAEQVESAAHTVEENFGPIDVWVNNAMVSVFSPIKEMTANEFRRVTEVTYLGYVYGTLAALKRMLPRDAGVIVQVGSALAYRGIPLQAAYCGAKHAIQGFVDSLRCELLHDRSKVRLTMVQMPALNTPQFSWVKSRLADWYLARNGYEAQQTDTPEQSDRPDNLWPLHGDHGAHGAFDHRARPSSWQFWLSVNRGRVGLAISGVLLAAMAIIKPSVNGRKTQLPNGFQ
jgi:NAD(P)-dependent dehydrogenase (short-subunit alcohol dehydrogenase family)